MPDLLLVRPPGARGPTLLPPLGLLYVASAAREAGYSVEVIDGAAEDLSWPGLVRRCEALAPRVVGLGGCSPLAVETLDAAQRLRQACDALVVGGPMIDAGFTDYLDEAPAVDAAVAGEAEATIGPLMAWLGGDRTAAPPRGVVTREHALRPRERTAELDRIAPPARDLVDPKLYRYPLATRRPVSTLVSGRGCPRRCVFCDKAVTGEKPRLHSPGRVLEELHAIAEGAGPGFVVFFDDDFTVDPRRTAEICDGMVAAGLPLQWKCEARADGVDAELLHRMKRAGCTTVALGVESAADASLRWLRKDITREQLRRAFVACAEAGLDVLAYVLVGIPGETPADVADTVAFCRRHGARWVQFSTLSPYPGTALFDEALAEGWLVHSTVRNPADAERLRPTLVAPPWDLPTLGTTLLRAYASFYLRPGVIARETTAGLRNDWRGSLRSATGFGRWMARESFIGFAHRSGLVDALFPR